MSGEHLQKLAVFLPEFWTKILWYWFFHSFPPQPTSVNLCRNSWIPPCMLHLHFLLCFALQILYGSPTSLCLGKISVCFRSPPPLSSLCKMLIVFSNLISLISFSWNVFVLFHDAFMQKVNILKLFEYTELLRCCYARRPFWQNNYFFQYFFTSYSQILYYIFSFCMVWGFICWVWFCCLVFFFKYGHAMTRRHE